MLILLHLTFMIAAALCLLAGVGIAMFGRKKRTWLKMHKNLNTAGFSLLAAGGVAVFAHVTASGGDHLAAPHAWFGASAALLAALTFFLGYYSLRAANKQAVRAVHRWSGRLALTAILGTLALGLSMIGIL
ncbi:MAG: hypothetical protein PHG54_10915 [Smithellaceae bacterium]|nr:hypothetical protein [Syntrophaceae bacterium]MDD4241929.1 hypothetical protein [Smithellaceae bacterium]NLX50889.1 hypothetical protein [Deltaproteobacteria bacterium]